MVAPLTHHLPLVKIQRTRTLSCNGKVLVRSGQAVSANDVVAETPGPGKYMLLDIRQALGVARDANLEKLLQRRIGEQLRAGDVIAHTGGLFRRVLRAPCDGVVAGLSAGKVLIETRGSTVQLLAGLNGTVVEVVSEKGAVIAADGVLVQGVWGNGLVNTGMLLTIGEGPGSELLPGSLEIGLRGAVLLCGYCIQAEALKTAAGLNLRGMILGSLGSDLEEMAGSLPFPVLVVDGFGREPMNAVAYRVLSTNEKRDVAVNAAAWNLKTGERPEAVISLPAEGIEVIERVSFQAGQTVRGRIQPYLGKTGTLLEVHPGLTRLGNGLSVPAAAVKFEDGQATLPLTNLDVIQ